MQEQIQQEIKSITKKLPPQTTLIAVSKTKPSKYIGFAKEVGQNHFGENYVSELVLKATIYPDANWHFIGHLQSNKISQIKHIKNLTVHTVDSVSLAQKLSTIEGVNIFLQVNISNEESKSGFKINDLQQSIQKIQSCNIKIIGLMCIGEPGNGEIEFKLMRTLRDQFLPTGKLSMGMSDDWEIAIKYESNFVRIGSQIFGEREKK
ncbi:Pyridoxal phosphate enzyme, YggS family [Spironucleus salmonicida]|uniref:Pyridoxal phosphate homeostasis protein n=1 Tax=Spironucleus salmonicida TaxID=348837 RepID=V6LKT0_9EUKA|nr:Pyridoxal phosphate enzyme, YggS family [Spironucleus salmonicida]|eukprot:EST45235.1 Pyridoxal phosphate enzyme, YggS family [Spironucleus salmonicida]